MSAMSVIAVGAYFEALADVQQVTVTSIAEQVGLQVKYIWRLRTGKIIDPSARNLRSLTDAVRGSWEDVGTLLANPDATESDGRAMALAWAVESRLIRIEDRRLFASASSDDLNRAAAYLRDRAAERQENGRHR